MSRFQQCVRAGRYPTASTGERAAHKLAGMVRDVSGLMGDIDAGLKAEFVELLGMAAWPDTRADVLRIIENALGEAC